MPRCRASFFVFAFILALFPFLAFSESITVDFDAIENLVAKQNLHAQGAKFIHKSAEAKRGHLRRSYYPRLAGRVANETYQTGSQESRNESAASVDLAVNLYRGGRDTLQDIIIESETSVAKLDSEQAVKFEIKKARESYWYLVAAREAKALLEDALSQNTMQLRSAKERVDAGLSTRTDIYEFEIYQVRLKQEQARNSLEIKKRELELAILLGFSQDITIKTLSKVSHLHNDGLLSEQFNPATHPSVLTLQMQSQAAKKEGEKAALWWAPSVDIYASHALNTYREREFEEQKERIESIVGVQATFELFDGFDSSTEDQHKRYAALGRMAESKQTAMELQAQVENARNELKVAHEIIHTFEKSLKLSKSYLIETLDEYKRGVKNSPDVLSALEKSLDLQLKFVELKLNYQLARTALLELLGK